ncbi:hypothetical protein PIB30_025520 [Stylosanthes scabra]|uniref:Uncharacterized protein n=1 Tax=Stylosanthes scabra TaxID=79078 RepID=A0ABU6YC98_9FABA|nr:hypothetical protein [Stylosanthes scabra]
MSFAAYKMMHCPTGIDNCASGFLTHSRADYVPRVPPLPSDDLDPDADWPNPATRRDLGPIPNLVITSANVLEVYAVRVQEEPAKGAPAASESGRGGVFDGVTGASLELVCHYR